MHYLTNAHMYLKNARLLTSCPVDVQLMINLFCTLCHWSKFMSLSNFITLITNFHIRPLQIRFSKIKKTFWSNRGISTVLILCKFNLNCFYNKFNSNKFITAFAVIFVSVSYFCWHSLFAALITIIYKSSEIFIDWPPIKAVVMESFITLLIAIGLTCMYVVHWGWFGRKSLF